MVAAAIKTRLKEIEAEVMALVANQQISLTRKNQQMKPLIDEKNLLERTLKELQTIQATDYSGRCGG